MTNITKANLKSLIKKFQMKIIKNLQLYYFSKDAIFYFSKHHKLEFKNYTFCNFSKKFQKVMLKDISKLKEIKYKDILERGKELTENELISLVFVLNISDFEAWIVESLNLIFSDDHKVLLRYVNPKKTPFNLSLLEQSSDLNEVWRKIIDRYLSNKLYDRKGEILRNLLSACNLKEDKKFKALIGEINENFLCRNLVVHNKNKINKEYLDKAGEYAKFKIGDIIQISEDYLFEQGDNLLFFMQKINKSILKQNTKG